ncbi:MAG: DUF3748 domain-containing protein, partial [Arenibacter sp.]|nr:DUF3748 domain-containing protein [Arenibacter sp.]
GYLRWHPKEHQLVYVWNNALIGLKLNEDKSVVLTEPDQHTPSNLVWSHDGHKIAYNKMVMDQENQLTKQIFMIEL